MKIDVYANADEAAREAAKFIASAAQAAVTARDLFTLAASGGTTPWQMLSCLAKENLPWSKIHVFQVDERIAPAGGPDRNLTHLRESLLSHAPLPLSLSSLCCARCAAVNCAYALFVFCNISFTSCSDALFCTFLSFNSSVCL